MNGGLIMSQNTDEGLGALLRRVSLFLAPLLLLAGPVLISLEVVGELIGCEEIVEEQLAHDSLVAMAYSNPARCLKAKMVEARKPTIVALGSSRVMQFREFFFMKPKRFYNAGGAVARIRDFNAFLEEVDTEGIELFVIALDQYYFNHNFDDMTRSPKSFENRYSAMRVLRKQTLLQNYWEGKIDLARIGRPARIGLTALMYDEGFRPDGSYRSGRLIKFPELAEDIDFHDTYDRIEAGDRRFQYGAEVNPEAFDELDDFLSACQKRRIQVVAILPPYAHEVWGALMEHGEEEIADHRYAYMVDLPSTLQPLFDRYGFEFFDFSDIARVGSPDDETLDGFHGSEVAYLRLTLKMAETSRILGDYVDADQLEKMLNGIHSALEISSTDGAEG